MKLTYMKSEIDASKIPMTIPLRRADVLDGGGRPLSFESRAFTARGGGFSAGITAICNLVMDGDMRGLCLAEAAARGNPSRTRRRPSILRKSERRHG